MQKEFMKIQKYIRTFTLKQNSLSKKFNLILKIHGSRARLFKSKIINLWTSSVIILINKSLFQNPLLNRLADQNDLIMIGRELKKNRNAYSKSINNSKEISCWTDNDTK